MEMDIKIKNNIDKRVSQAEKKIIITTINNNNNKITK